MLNLVVYEHVLEQDVGCASVAVLESADKSHSVCASENRLPVSGQGHSRLVVLVAAGAVRDEKAYKSGRLWIVPVQAVQCGDPNPRRGVLNQSHNILWHKTFHPFNLSR